jgi:hypothetical protein
LREPFGDDSRLARASFRVENEDAHSAFTPGVIERGQLGGAPREAVSIRAQHFQSIGDEAGRWRDGHWMIWRFDREQATP